ncbi:hypothetical protein LTR85_005230 [Meristemomyces frigidus]|nr:hypothetical protein LTR85_005230 [Meristemomyces frigidus]
MSILALVVLFVARLAHSLPLNSPLLSSYDYIVVGGGPAGLTVANRLSEDLTVNVLLIEAGPADVGEAAIQLPGMIGHEIGSIYDWNLSSVSQTYLDGAPRAMPQGHGLGGGTLINGMLWNRGSIADYDAWVELGNDGWAWDDLLPYFKKSETFMPVSSVEVDMQYSIEADPEVHGSEGPVSVSFPNYKWNSSAVLFDALNELGIPTAYDPNTGRVAGASFLPLNLVPESQTRSTARTAYYDPITARPNLWVSTGQYVTQVLFADAAANAGATVPSEKYASNGQGSAPSTPGSIYGGGTMPMNISDIANTDAPPVKRGYLGRLWTMVKRATMPRQSSSTVSAASSSLTAIGVEYAANSQTPPQNVTATREVIISAGALHSPQILMLSGIGPASTLQAQQLSVNVDLPGVGSNLHDHAQVWCWYPYYNSSYPNPTMLSDVNGTFADNAENEYWHNQTGPLTSSAIDGVAFPPLPLVTNGSTAIADAASAQTAQQYLPANADPSVVAGFAKQLPMLIEALSDPNRAGYEIINANDGGLTVGNMRPLSRGTITLSSSQPFNPPLIDPRYGSNPVDAQVLIAAMRFNQRLLTTSSLSEMDPLQISPPVKATDEELLTYIDGKLRTEYHAAGTCAMMPLELGGVVSPELLVYGTSNLRVVDSSIIPVLPAAHLQAVVYGIAEKAADIIKAANADVVVANSTSTQSTAPNAVQSSAVVQSPPTTAPAGAATLTTFVTVVQTETCTRAITIGYCWTVIWGDHNVVIPSRCSYCKAGLNKKKPLGSAWPVGELVANVGRSRQSDRNAGGNRSAGQGAKVHGLLGPARSNASVTREIANVDESGIDPLLLVSDQPDGAEEDGSFEMPQEVELPTPPFELDDVLGTDFGSGFDLSQEMWQYA